MWEKVMNGFSARTASASVFVAAALATGSGCHAFKAALYDPCYPERYWHSSRELVRGHFVPQVNNGHILDQTVWNYHFEPGKAALTNGGMEHLAYLARRRPCPDQTIYLQVAQDITYDPAAPEQFVEERNQLDAERIQSIQNYLQAQTAGRSVVFHVVRHDPPDATISAVPIGVSIRQMQATSQGVRTIAASGTGSAGGAR
jgi:hypothetical protein